MGIFNSRRPPAPPALPPQPTPPEVLDIIDELNGTETITAVGPDGRKRRITRRLPLTPEEQAIANQSQNLMRQAISNIETLYQYNPNAVVDYQPFINTFAEINQERVNDLAQIGNFADIANQVQRFRDINRNLVNREFDRQQRYNENILAKRGLSNSSLAAETRANLSAERALAEGQLDINANIYGENLANAQLTRERNLYDTREAGRQGRLQQASTGYNLAQQHATDLENRRQQAINENMNFLNIGQNNLNNQFQRSALGLQAEGLAQRTALGQASNQNQRYANDINRLMSQHQLNMQAFNNQPVSFGQRLADLGVGFVGQGIGNFLGNVGSSFGRRANV